MSVRIDIRYDGKLHCTSVHEPSRSSIATDAPRDNQGLGESFSPTDLVATALGTCMLTTMAIGAKQRGLDIDGGQARVDKEMVADPKRRIGKLTVMITLPATLNAEARSYLEHVAATCPVSMTVSERVEVALTFEYV